VKRYLIILLSLTQAIFCGFTDEYDFEIPEEREDTLALHGYLSGRYSGLYGKKDTTGYKLQFYGEDNIPSFLSQYAVNFFLLGDFSTKHMGLHVKTHINFSDLEIGFDLYEARGSINFSYRAYLQMGKIIYNWGKGYVFNPVGFVNPEKDPEDPEAINEGLLSVNLELIKSFSSNFFKTTALSTVLILPYPEIGQSYDFRNTDFALKAYFLLWNIDIDLMGYLSRENPMRVGADFAFNIIENIEFHGEFAYSWNVPKETFASSNPVTEDKNNLSCLTGFRFLTPWNMTIIIEYYYNGFGLKKNQYKDFISYLGHQIDTDMSSLIGQIKKQYMGKLNKPGMTRHYLYLKIIQQEPFHWVYFNIGIAMLWNLEDMSLSLSLPLSYKPVANFEVALKPSLFVGRKKTEFGSRTNFFRLDLELYFHY
jgi:hypothetical protein